MYKLIMRRPLKQGAPKSPYAHCALLLAWSAAPAALLGDGALLNSNDDSDTSNHIDNNNNSSSNNNNHSNYKSNPK